MVAQGGDICSGGELGGAEPSSHLATRGWELRDCWPWPAGGNGDSDGMGMGQGLCPKS